MFRLSKDDENLLGKLTDGISNEMMSRNWEEFMSFTPAPSGSPQGESAMQFIRGKLEEYGIENQLLRFDAYLSLPKYARLDVIEPVRKEVHCAPYRQVGTTGPEGIKGECIYIPPESIGMVECRDKIIVIEQKAPGPWSGLRYKSLLRLQEMGVKGLIVISQDDFMPNIIHQHADFSVSGNPIPENIEQIHRIPAIVVVSNKDGEELRGLARSGNMHVHVVSAVETGWKNLPILVGEIKGAREPDRFLLVFGHVDTPPFSPGVTDNASGAVALLEMARLLNEYRDHLGRSVRFAFWTGHEIGRYAGSTWYNDAFWHELRYRCICTLEMDSPGPEGATIYPYVPIGETYDLILESQRYVIDEVGEDRWMGRCSDRSFFGTGVPHGYLYPARPKESFDPSANYSGGGWWWHTPWATLDRGNVDILARDVKSNLYFAFKMTNCRILPFSYASYAKAMVGILTDLQESANKIRSYFNLAPVIERAKEFMRLAGQLEECVQRANEAGASDSTIERLNKCLMEIARHITPIARWNAEKTAQISMEDVGYTPFPRLNGIRHMTDIALPETHEFKLWCTKLQRERNNVEDGFYLANEAIRGTLAAVEGELS